MTIQNSKESSLQLSMYVITSVIYEIGNVPLTKRVPQTFEKIAQHTTVVVLALTLRPDSG